MSKKRKISWAAVEELLNATLLAVPEDIKKLPVLVVGRGGMPVAALAQYHLQSPHYQILTLQSYREEQRESINLISPPVSMYPVMLIIDDLVDSGETIKWILKRYPYTKFYLLTLFRKEHSPFFDIGHYYGAEVDSNCWIVFPWE